MLDGVFQSGQMRQQKTTVSIVLVRPNGCGEAWVDGPITTMAKQLGFNVASIGEDEAWRFGASTSGEVVAYDEEGRLRFHGSITRGRGHEGRNPGVDALHQFLNDQVQDLVETPLFGCALTQSIQD